MRRTWVLVAAVILGLVAGCTGAPTSAEQPQLSAEGFWIRTTTDAKDATMTAAFGTVVNPGNADVRLVSADCAAAGMVQLHEMVDSGGKKMMSQAKDGLVVPAGSHLHLTPGGYHIMLMQLTQQLPVGEQVELTLHFSDGSTLGVTAPVKEFVEEEDHYHSPIPTPSP